MGFEHPPGSYQGPFFIDVTSGSDTDPSFDGRNPGKAWKSFARAYEQLAPHGVNAKIYVARGRYKEQVRLQGWQVEAYGRTNGNTGVVIEPPNSDTDAVVLDGAASGNAKLENIGVLLPVDYRAKAFLVSHASAIKTSGCAVYQPKLPDGNRHPESTSVGLFLTESEGGHHEGLQFWGLKDAMWFDHESSTNSFFVTNAWQCEHYIWAPGYGGGNMFWRTKGNGNGKSDGSPTVWLGPQNGGNLWVGADMDESGHCTFVIDGLANTILYMAQAPATELIVNGDDNDIAYGQHLNNIHLNGRGNRVHARRADPAAKLILNGPENVYDRWPGAVVNRERGLRPTLQPRLPAGLPQEPTNPIRWRRDRDERGRGYVVPLHQPKANPFNDTFRRADGPLGPPWQILRGQWGVRGNTAAHLTAESASLAVVDFMMFDGAVECDFPVLGTGGSHALAVRVADGTNFILVNGPEGHVRTVANGAAVETFGPFQPIPAGGFLRVEMKGDLIRVFGGGPGQEYKHLIDARTTFNLQRSKHGLYSNYDTVGRWADFRLEQL